MGHRVSLQGCSRAGLNGLQGIAESWNSDSKRYVVRLSNGDKLALKPVNVLRIDSDAGNSNSQAPEAAGSGAGRWDSVTDSITACRLALTRWWTGLENVPKMCVILGAIVLVLWGLSAIGGWAKPSGFSTTGWSNRRQYEQPAGFRYGADSHHNGFLPMLVFAAVAFYGYRQGWSFWTILSMAQLAQNLVGGGRGSHMGYGRRPFGLHRRGFF